MILEAKGEIFLKMSRQNFWGFTFLALFSAVFVLSSSEPVHQNENEVELRNGQQQQHVSVLGRCPWTCTCTGMTADCSHRGLTKVPDQLPTDAERM